MDKQVERGLVQILEKKYQETAVLLDKAEMEKQNAQFECEIAKKEKQKYLDLYNQ